MYNNKREETMQYIINNNKDNESFEKSFSNSGDARNWITNHLDLSKEWNITPKPITIKDFIAHQYIKFDNKITMQSEYSDSNPNMNDLESSRMNHFVIRLKRKFRLNGNHLDTRYGYRQLKLYFSQGIGINGDPKVENVLDCLKSDYFVAQDGFEEFCANCGYSNDSIKSLKTYKIIKKQSKKLETFLGNAFKDFLKCESL